MTKTIERTAYRYEELPEKVQHEILWHSGGLDGSVVHDTAERLNGYLADVVGGTHVIELCWSLSHCQGDGVAFYGQVYIEDMIAAIEGHSNDGWWNEESWKTLDPQGILPILHEMVAHGLRLTLERTDISNHYSHWNTFRTTWEEGGCPMADLANTDCMYPGPSDREWDAVTEFFRKLSRALEREGYDFIEALEAPDNVKYHYAGAWFDATGRLMEWDEDRDEHAEQLDKADREKHERSLQG